MIEKPLVGRTLWAAVALLVVGGGQAEPSPSDPQAVSVAAALGDTADGRPATPGVDPIAGAGLWVVDEQGVAVGVLVRRGSDDTAARSSVYDRVQVYHPASALFFDVTMHDGRVRFPEKVYFKGSSCTVPLGIAVGACGDCRAGYQLAFMHEERWYEVIGGSSSEVIPNDASLEMGISSSCVPHSSSSTRAFPVREVSGETPPQRFTPPLRFVWQ